MVHKKVVLKCTPVERNPGPLPYIRRQSGRDLANEIRKYCCESDCTGVVSHLISPYNRFFITFARISMPLAASSLVMHKGGQNRIVDSPQPSNSSPA